MKIVCLQFAPKRGDIEANIDCVNEVLKDAHSQDIDLLVLPEMALTGNNFKSLQDINACLESTTLGITYAWARHTALVHQCVVVIGYPEKVDTTEGHLNCYNSAITIDANGDMIANYRKLFLDDWDKPWALEGGDGFFFSEIPTLGKVAIGIGMDLEGTSTVYEFAHHILTNHANIAIIPMAWISQGLNIRVKSEEPDLETLSHWVARLEPLIQANEGEEIIVVIANRYGTEEEATYAGTSCVLSIEGGEVKVYDILDNEEEELLIIDTSQPPNYKLVNKLNADSPGRNSATTSISSSIWEPLAETPHLVVSEQNLTRRHSAKW